LFKDLSVRCRVVAVVSNCVQLRCAGSALIPDLGSNTLCIRRGKVILTRRKRAIRSAKKRGSHPFFILLATFGGRAEGRGEEGNRIAGAVGTVWRPRFWPSCPAWACPVAWDLLLLSPHCCLTMILTPAFPGPASRGRHHNRSALLYDCTSSCTAAAPVPRNGLPQPATPIVQPLTKAWLSAQAPRSLQSLGLGLTDCSGLLSNASPVRLAHTTRGAVGCSLQQQKSDSQAKVCHILACFYRARIGLAVFE